MCAAPRIDSLKNQLTGTKELLDEAGSLVQMLHELAYDRHAASERMRVAESEPEGYSLDNHGDPRARSAYVALSQKLYSACSIIDGAARRCVDIVSEGEELDPESDSPTRHPVSVDVLEHAEAIDAQRRRVARGEFDPGATAAQPKRRGAERTATRRIRLLEQQVRKGDSNAARRIRTLEAQVRRKDKALDVRDRTIAGLRAELETERSVAP